MTRVAAAEEKRRKKEGDETLLSVIQFLLDLAHAPLSPFRPSPIFRRPLFMCFSVAASRQRRELPTRR